MLMSYLWLGMAAAAVLYGCAGGNIAAVSSGLMEGAGEAVTLCITVTGALCLWSAVMEVMRQSGLSDSLSRLLGPLLRRLYPGAFSDPDCARAISENFSANLLGLGNAATPAGIRAVKGMVRLRGAPVADGELCRFVVMNTASVQLIPATAAAIRAGCGAADAFDILPCVWLSSLFSVCIGLLAAKALERLFP